MSSLKKICEGTTDLYVYLEKRNKSGPGTKTPLPFYNPAMEFNRDSSLLLMQWLVESNVKPIMILDGLAASGIRGFRFAHEIAGDFSVIINDWNQNAYNLIKKNYELRSDKSIIIENTNLHRLLVDQKYDYIDVDPFGSPIDFIDGAMRCIRHNGIVACTATDTAALNGVYPKVCLRRYAAIPFRNYLMREIGIRILLGVLSREAAKYEKGIQPLWCYTRDHYFRVYIQVQNGVQHCNKSISQYQPFFSSELPLSQSDKKKIIGPLWAGPLHNKEIIHALQFNIDRLSLGTSKQLLKLLTVCYEEADLPPFFYSTDAAASLFKNSPKKLQFILDALHQEDYLVSRCSFSPYGFRTTAEEDYVIQLLKK